MKKLVHDTNLTFQVHKGDEHFNSLSDQPGNNMTTSPLVFRIDCGVDSIIHVDASFGGIVRAYHPGNPSYYGVYPIYWEGSGFDEGAYTIMAMTLMPNDTEGPNLMPGRYDFNVSVTASPDGTPSARALHSMRCGVVELMPRGESAWTQV